MSKYEVIVVVDDDIDPTELGNEIEDALYDIYRQGFEVEVTQVEE